MPLSVATRTEHVAKGGGYDVRCKSKIEETCTAILLDMAEPPYKIARGPLGDPSSMSFAQHITPFRFRGLQEEAAGSW
jgi:hypothetical protein